MIPTELTLDPEVKIPNALRPFGHVVNDTDRRIEMTTFIVDGKEKEIEMIGKNGIDWSDDFVGNNSHGMTRNDEGNYIVTEQDYRWWKGTIAAHQEMNASIERYKETYGRQSVHEWLEINRAFESDFEFWPENVSLVLKKLDVPEKKTYTVNDLHQIATDLVDNAQFTPDKPSTEQAAAWAHELFEAHLEIEDFSAYEMQTITTHIADTILGWE